MKVFLDGRIVDAEKAVISPFDHGFLYGLGLFETMRVYGGHIALLEKHYERLRKAAEELGIVVTMTREELRFAILQTLSANGLENAYVRVDLTAGDKGLGAYAGIYDEPRWLIFAKPLPDFPSSLYEKGKRLQILTRPRNSPEGEWRFKSHHYMNNRFGKMEIGNDPNVEGLFLTESGCIAEGIVSNVFFVSEDTLYTPDVKTGILPGTRREFVMELAEECGIAVREGWYYIEHLMVADEVFITNAIQEIVPIHAVNEKTIGKGTIGAVTRQLLELYRQRII
ncbi:aminodeoxychorismate lyase [Aneurinibacillus thermoaerophilus]|uniref:aminodeoxychorismate lyase n=1 Tax=Aneurinibacillus thermoaerophilus TaxID=143495 RepID=UPI002E1F8682|nr:aminodeoxychorismate lyase [Aneurinibacillus thermoaerophilus]MED0681038.1 aminodeoxychorismate lyase [Aneurinibacillus thermoaerophilus]MED0766047.1 aminodeoxychorismate lyase [Aneurinibacillus thermoaerophilus]